MATYVAIKVISIEGQLVEIRFNIIFFNCCKRDNLKLVFKSTVQYCTLLVMLVLILFDAK